MSLIQKIKDNQVTKQAFVNQLNQYQIDKIELQRNAGAYGPELFKSKMRELDLAISYTEIFIEKFDDIREPHENKPKVMRQSNR